MGLFSHNLKHHTKRVLTDREVECLDLFDKGMTPSEIDERLGWGEGNTVALITDIWQEMKNKTKEVVWVS